MLIQKIDPDAFYAAYGIRCQHVAPWEGVSEAPFATTWCSVPPGGVARAHKHQEHESFVIVRGHGRMSVDGETAEVGPGDVVAMPPFSVHELTNASADEELLFLDLVWEAMGEAAERNRQALAAGRERGRREVLVTATPPTPNGNLHVGHLSGPDLGADVHTRYLRLRGHLAHYLSGVDDHQSYTEVRAMRDGQTARAVADRFGDAMAETLSRAAIELDLFARPQRSPHHVALVQRVFGEMFESGHLVARRAPTLWCERCRMFLFEAHVVGRCPRCGEGSNGNACEACGWPNDCVDLVEPRCRHCDGVPQVRPLERIYFPLAPWAGELEEWWSRTPMSPHLRWLCEDMLSRGLPDIAVSQRTDWGVRVPVAGFEEQAIYVWFEMGPGYLAATQEMLDRQGGGGGWREVWGEGGRDVVQFFGFDNGYFHALLFPATFLAWDPGIRLPAAFVTNEFYRYEGSKFSTSRNHAMWGPELLDRVPVDAARFFLAWDGPEREQSNFTLARLRDTVERELVEGWEPWLRELGARVAEEFDGALPGTGAWSADQQRFFDRLVELSAEVAAAYEAETFSPQRAVRLLSELVRLARRFAAAESHWRGLPGRFEERRTAVALEAMAAKVLALGAAPLMPGFAGRLWRALGYDRPMRWEEVPEPVPSGRDLGGLDRPWFSDSVEERRTAIA
jgi:methionyl-tRNA synthetase